MGVGPKYWRSLDELADTPEFRSWVEREFPEGASEFSDPVSRRHFVKIMSASFLLAGVGLTGCRRPVENIVPFTKVPEGYVHGVPSYYATSMPARGSAIPLLVKSHEARPIKIEGNADHPIHKLEGDTQGKPRGGTDTFTQASILGLYDPDRAQRFTKGGTNVSREQALDALTQISKQAAANQGKGLAILLERSSSPTRARVIASLRQTLPQAKTYEYEPVDSDIARQSASLAFGQSVKPFYRLEKARKILSLDADFLGAEGDTYRQIRGYSASRRLHSNQDEMSRLYVAESFLTVTGSNADHRLRISSSGVFSLTCLLFAEFISQSKAGEKTPEAKPFGESLLKVAEGLDATTRKWAKECVADLLKSRAESVVLAGARQPLEVHLLAHAFNVYLGAVGNAVVYLPVEDPKAGTITELAKSLKASEVETLVILGGNPVYTAPADLEWAATQRKAKQVVRLGYYEDETFKVSDLHLPASHYLESWGDARTADGTVVAIQPLIDPIFGGLTEIEVLARLGGQSETRPYDIVRTTFRGLVGGGFTEDAWGKFLHDGFLAGSASKAVEVAMDWNTAGAAVLGASIPTAPTAKTLELVFSTDYSVEDGRYNNNGWLQELPDPITKIVWDNAIYLSPKTAADLGINVVDPNKLNLAPPVVKVTVGGRSFEGPAWIQPGLADNIIGVTLGYGRTETGRVGRGTGYNAYVARTSSGLTYASGATIAETGARYPISCTQNHWYMEGRSIIREANLDEYKKNAHFALALNLPEAPDERPLYPNPLDVPNAQGLTPKQEATHMWGMSVDLNACVGCAACSIACQGENNVPIVGKDQVRRNREMHWIRIDRYFTGSLNDPQVINQPMMCQHCESAPCENVCPVNATVHDTEGLNLMVYNRCVGTRYCSNNCPYKVRRFNFFDYNRRPLDGLYKSPLVTTTDGEWELLRWFKNPDRGSKKQDEWDLMKLARNPDVTVRMRGVMEKCTYCLQRIEQGKIGQKVKAGASGNVEVPDGVIRTACQQACPADAIVFGNMKNPENEVAKAKSSDRTYSVLEFLSTKPRTTYLARVRNPNPLMPDYQPIPLSTKEFLDHGGTLQSEAGHEHGHGHEAAAPSGGHGETVHGGETKGAH